MKCPKCGKEGSLFYQSIQQAAYENKILKNVKLSKNYRYVKCGSEGWGLIACKTCGMCITTTQNSSFHFDNDGILHIEEGALDEAEEA